MFVFTIQLNAFSQKKIKRGLATYEVIEVISDQTESEMLLGSQIDICFDNKRHKMDMSLMGGMIRIQSIRNEERQENMVLTDIAGRQIKVVNEIKPKTLDTYIIEYDKKDEKEIAGYNCYKAVMKGESDELIELYVTSKIDPKSSFFDELFPGLKGFPLEYTINSENLRITYLAKAILDKPDFDKLFTISDTYEEMTKEDFEKEMGVMNFGF